jgi:hypothetical protein
MNHHFRHKVFEVFQSFLHKVALERRTGMRSSTDAKGRLGEAEYV